MTDIKISIVVPIYNVREYVEKCIESIMTQSYKNIEIILVDDGSTDGSGKICDHYAQTDNRIKVIHKKNGGLVSARKAGTEFATGDYVINVDGDDWIENDRIEVLVNEGIMPSKADMIHMAGHKRDFGEESVFTDEYIPTKMFYGSSILNEVFPLFAYSLPSLKRGLLWCLWGWAFRSDLLKKNQKLVDDRISMGEDLVCVWLCLLEAESVSVIKHSGYHYIQRKSSITHTNICEYSARDSLWQIKIVYHQLKEHLIRHDAPKSVTESFIRTMICVLIHSNYAVLLRIRSEYLFPFPDVRNGSRIVVYGAGKIGYALMNYLSMTDDYKVMLWVDKNTSRPAVEGWVVSPVEDIDKVEYDKIVVAVMFEDTFGDIRESLKLRGIPEEKISTMNVGVFTEDMIPDEVKCMQS